LDNLVVFAAFNEYKAGELHGDHVRICLKTGKQGSIFEARRRRRRRCGGEVVRDTAFERGDKNCPALKVMLGRF
jgi:hypothetical protein